MSSSRPPRFASLLPSLLALFLAACSTPQPAPPNSLTTHDSSKWEKDIAAFEQSDRTNPPPANGIVLVGSSSIRMWKSLATDFPGLPVFNRGFGGSQLADAVNFADRIILPYRPRQVVVYSGGNDINAGKHPEVVYGDFVVLAERIRAALPNTRITYIAIAPNPKRWAQMDRVREANRLIEDYCRRHRGFEFLDTHPLMLGANGLPLPHIYLADQLHMNEHGYAIWAKAVRPYLK
jgi:lysophospholipase L1-like esterase